MKQAFKIDTHRVVTPHFPACSFCKIGRGESANWIDRPLAETESFVAIPSLGSITAGWIMIVPKFHALNFSASYNDAEFRKLANEVINHLKPFGGQIHMFEHGPLDQGSATGCGVDHAHVHFVPLSRDFSGTIESLDPSLVWNEISLEHINNVFQDKEYLLYSTDAENHLDRVHVAKLDAPRSQFFRRAVAAQLNLANHFDYKEHDFLDNVEETYRVFHDMLSNESTDTSLAILNTGQR